MSKKTYNPGDIEYVWIPYTKDTTNGILGSIVQVKLLKKTGEDTWKCYIRLSGKPTTQTAKGDILYITEDEFFDSDIELADYRTNMYRNYIYEQVRYLYQYIDKAYNAPEEI